MKLLTNGKEYDVSTLSRTDIDVKVTFINLDISAAFSILNDNDVWSVDGVDMSDYSIRGVAEIDRNGIVSIVMVFSKPSYTVLEQRLNNAVEALNIVGVKEDEVTE